VISMYNKRLYKYYFHKDLKVKIWWEILKDVRGHEVGFIPMVQGTGSKRFMTIGKIDFLVKNLKYFFCQGDYNVYHLFRGLEYVRASDVVGGSKFKKKYEDSVYGMDYVVDVDAEGDLDLAKSVAGEVVDLFNRYKMPYEIKFSGSKGFHLVVYWKFLNKYIHLPIRHLWIDSMNTVLLDNINRKYHKYVDLATNRTHGLFRVKYSMHPKTRLVSVPLTLKEFESFSTELADPFNDNFTVKNSLVLTNDGSSLNSLVKNYPELDQKTVMSPELEKAYAKAFVAMHLISELDASMRYLVERLLFRKR